MGNPSDFDSEIDKKTDDSDQYFDFSKRESASFKTSQTVIQLRIQCIDNLTEIKKSSSSWSQEYNDFFESQIQKIVSLKPLAIPMEDGTSKKYYSIADDAGGVTEKTCLISEEDLLVRLKDIATAKTFDIKKGPKIQMNAILKHPKKGWLTIIMEKLGLKKTFNLETEVLDTEVQREAIGLRIARVLGFKKVTKSTMVSHNTGDGFHPCLFVPFENMELLTGSIDDKNSSHGRIDSSKHDSMEDFGKYSAYFLCCSDTDFIGKDGQNKGLKEQELYIFDQVFMKDTNFSFDHGLNLIPTNNLSSLPYVIARHFMGRNKSVVNDSSYEEKVKGVISLLQKKDAINTIFIEAAKTNKKNITHSKTSSIFQKLWDDSNTCLASFNKRIGFLQKVIPHLRIDNQPINVDSLDEMKLELLAKSMLLNKLLNEPVLFDKAGKRYRVPFFCQAKTTVRSVSFNENANVSIELGRRSGMELSPSKQNMLFALGFTISDDGKSVTINHDNLLKLNENEIFDIQKKIDANCQYLDKNDIRELAKSYRANNSTLNAVLQCVSEIKSLDSYLAAIQTLEKIGQDRGYIEHIKLKVLFSAVQKIVPNNDVLKDDFIKSKNKVEWVKNQISIINSRVRVDVQSELCEAFKNLRDSGKEELQELELNKNSLN